MKRVWIAGFVLVAGCAAASAAVALDATRSYVAAVRIEEQEAARFDLAPPRMSAPELAKVLAQPGLVQALNQQHLANIGTFTAGRPVMIGGRFVESGAYETGIELTGRGLALLLRGTHGAAERIELEPGPGSGACGHVPQAAFAFLGGEVTRSFELEVRFGGLRGTTTFDLREEEVIAGMNNLAYELLTAGNDARSRPAVERALRLARTANAMSGGSQADVLDTLALAFFHAGDVEQAIATQEKAIAAVPAGDQDSRTAKEAQLARFKNGGG